MSKFRVILKTCRFFWLRVSYLFSLSILIATGISDTDKSAVPAIFSHPSANVFATARASIAISMFLVFISFLFLKTVISSQTDGFCYICSVLINHLLLWKIVFMNSSDRSTTRLLVLYAVRILHSSLKENPLFHTVAVIMSVNS